MLKVAAHRDAYVCIYLWIQSAWFVSPAFPSCFELCQVRMRAFSAPSFRSQWAHKVQFHRGVVCTATANHNLRLKLVRMTVIFFILKDWCFLVLWGVARH